jgi:hypothetical protein
MNRSYSIFISTTHILLQDGELGVESLRDGDSIKSGQMLRSIRQQSVRVCSQSFSAGYFQSVSGARLERRGRNKALQSYLGNKRKPTVGGVLLLGRHFNYSRGGVGLWWR